MENEQWAHSSPSAHGSNGSSLALVPLPFLPSATWAGPSPCPGPHYARLSPPLTSPISSYVSVFPESGAVSAIDAAFLLLPLRCSIIRLG